MKRSLWLAAVLALGWSAPPAAAQPGTAEAEPMSAKEANRRICRSLPTTGSRTSRNRECKTRAEWADYNRRANQDTSEVFDKKGLVR